MSRRSSGDHLGTQRGERYAASCTRPGPHCSRRPRVQQPWGGEAPSAQHPVPSTQRCRAPQSFTSPAGCKDQPAAGSKTPGGAPGRRRARGPGRGDGSSSSMEQTGSSTGWLEGKRGRNEPRKPRGEGFVGTGGRGPARGGRQAPAAADPTRKAAAQRDPAR